MYCHPTSMNTAIACLTYNSSKNKESLSLLKSLTGLGDTGGQSLLAESM